MSKIGAVLDRIIAYLGYAGAAMGVFSVIAMMLMISLSVMLRYLFHAPFKFTDEYSAYLLVIVVYMGFAYAMRKDEHIRVELLVRHLPKKVNAALEVIYPLVMLFLMGIYFRYSLSLFMESVRTRAVSLELAQTPLWIPHMFLWLGLGILGLELMARTVKKFIAFQRGWKETTDKDAFRMPNV